VVRYNRRGRLDTSRVRDRRGAGSGGKVAVGGVGGLVLVLLAMWAGVDPSLLLEASGGGGQAPPADGGLAACTSGADIETDRDCRFVAYENSVQGFWEDEFARRGGTYQPASVTIFTGGVRTGCGAASSAMGPFYCPADQGIYLDLGFFSVLEDQFGARGGDLAEAYVVAHEAAHHVQHLIGQDERVRTREGPTSDAVRLELQADCLAGVWTHHATRTPEEGSDTPIITEISEDDVAIAIDAAERIGDDYIQTRSQGNVTPETWTHGSSEQRARWFETGRRDGDLEDCDTWATEKL
jgi:predicted metalloprotease